MMKCLLVFFKIISGFVGKASRLIQQKTLQNMMYNVWQHALTEQNWYLLIDVYKSVLVVEHKKNRDQKQFLKL